MRGVPLFHRLTLPVAAAILGACAGGAPTALPPTAVNPAPNSVAGPAAQSRVAGGSWMSPDAAQRDLLYVSNANGTVSVYRYWQHTLVGVLTNFSKPQGECSDRAGNVYIADSANKKVYEYAHGGKKPIRVLSEAPLQPYGCSVSPANGDLAVANAAGDEYTPGNLTIYPHGTGTPKTYQGPYDDHFINCAYDDRGDLFANSQIVYYYSFFYEIAFYYLPKRGPNLIPEKLSDPYFSSGWPYVYAVSFDGKYWVVDAANELFLYKININPQYIGKIEFTGNYGIGPATLLRKTLAGRATQIAGAADTRSTSAVDYWKYPDGGSPIYSITKDLDDPTGIAISLGRSAR